MLVETMAASQSTSSESCEPAPTASALPIPCGHSYRAGDLADYFGISPRDILDKTADIASKWWHADEPNEWPNYRDVLAWLKRLEHGIFAADVEVVLEVEWSRIVEACGGEVES